MSRQALENHGIVSARQSQDQPAFHPIPFPEEELVLAVIASPEAEDPPQDPNLKGARAWAKPRDQPFSAVSTFGASA